jgi:tetratricopeptide (TPR) repeat protein
MANKLLLTFVFFIVTTLSFTSAAFNVEQNIKKVERYFIQDSENLPYEDIIALSIKIMEFRERHTADTLGKTYILLANVASNMGEDNEAFQFSQDGLSLQGLDNAIKFNLMLKSAEGYYLKEKYEQTQSLATNVILMAVSPEVLKYRLIALSYRAVAYALQNQNDLALNDLEQVDILIRANPQYRDHLCLLEILATAHYYLGDYQNSLTMQNKLLTLRFDLDKLANIDQTYLHLGRAYSQLNLLDDAYNAYWEAQKNSKNKKAPIRVAYAELGLAEVLLKQKNFRASHHWLLSASATFNEKNLSNPYLTSLVLLAETANLLSNHALHKHYLHLAELMAKTVKLSEKQSKLLLLLSEMYQKNGDYKNALLMHKNYLELLQQFQGKVKPSLVINSNQGLSANNKSRNLILGLAEKSELQTRYKAKYIAQKETIYLLMFVISILLITIVFFGLRQRILRLNQVYDEVEQPLSYLVTPSQTKRNYQLHYKMARKYDYPLAVGYFSVINWQELSFHFNRKIMQEVSKTLATLLNESKGEFDEAGTINDGEYLLLGPHQTENEIAAKLNSLAAAIKVRFFANLGDYSVNIGYAYGLPTAQDIDPYIFLSRLSETTKA